MLPVPPAATCTPCRTCVYAALLLATLLTAACSGRPSALPPQHTALAGADAQQGRRLLEQYQCGSCHAIPGIAAARAIAGPSLKGFGKRSYIAGHIPNFPDALVRWIVAPAALVPDTAMPAMGVAPDEARHMAAYLVRLD